jgi:glucose/arabinose dehydrogenase
MKRNTRTGLRVGMAGALALFGAACQDRTPPTATDAEANLSHSPSGPEFYVAELTPLNNSGVNGAAAFVIHNGEFTARVFARGMVPNELHPQHIHGLDGNQNGVCPAPSAASRMPNSPSEAANPDQFISVAEGLPDYGAIRVPLDSELVPIPAGEFPTADADGIVNYLQKTSFSELQAALGDFQLRPLEDKVVVLHGGFVTGADGQQVYVPSLPVACAQIRMTSKAEARERQPSPPSQVIGGGPAVGLRVVADGLSNPVTLEEAPDGSGRLFIVEQIGRIRILMPNGQLRDEPFLDVRDRMVDLRPDFDERGLLGLAFHPQFASNGRFFVYYNAPPRIPGYNNTSVVAEFRADPADQGATPQFVREVITENQPQFNHNGGTITFGPDGYLYIAWGDGGGRDDEGGNPFTAPLRNTPVFGHVDDWYERNAGGNGQGIEQNLLGSILRIDVNGGTPYAIPFDNPFVGKPGRDEIYAYGLRNPYRMSFDMSGNRALYAGDAGQDMWEEISIITKGGNYGWNVKEGAHCFDAEEPRTIPQECPSVDPTTGIPLTDPVIELPNHHNPFFHGVGTVIIGGYVYRGNDVPQLKGQYIFGIASTGHDAAAGVLFVAKPRNPNRPGVWPVQRVQVTNVPGEHQDGHEGGHEDGHEDGHEGGQLNGAVLGFGQDLRGEVYVLTSKSMGPEGTTGQVLKFVQPSGRD